MTNIDSISAILIWNKWMRKKMLVTHTYNAHKLWSCVLSSFSYACTQAKYNRHILSQYGWNLVIIMSILLGKKRFFLSLSISDRIRFKIFCLHLFLSEIPKSYIAQNFLTYFKCSCRVLARLLFYGHSHLLVYAVSEKRFSNDACMPTGKKNSEAIYFRNENS